MDYREKSDIRDGMRIDWDMPIEMDDGLVLRAAVMRSTLSLATSSVNTGT